MTGITPNLDKIWRNLSTIAVSGLRTMSRNGRSDREMPRQSLVHGAWRAIWPAGGQFLMIRAGLTPKPGKVACSAMSGMNFSLSDPPSSGALRPFAPAAIPARAAGDDDKRRSGERGPGTAVITKTKPQTKRPSLYRVLLLNDDYTPMEFVVHVLERFFNKDREA